MSIVSMAITYINVATECPHCKEDTICEVNLDSYIDDGALYHNEDESKTTCEHCGCEFTVKANEVNL